MDATEFHNEIRQSLINGALSNDALCGIIELTKNNLRFIKIDTELYDDIIFNAIERCIKYYTKYRDCGSPTKCRMYFNTIIKHSIVTFISPEHQKQLRREGKLEELLA